MKKLSQLDSYLNENLQAGKTDSENGTGFVTVKNTEDRLGFAIDFSLQFSVMEADLPANAQAQLKKVLDEIEEKITGELPWLQ